MVSSRSTHRRLTASFRPRRWWHGIVGQDLFDPEVDVERPEWVSSRKRRPAETVEAALQARMLAASFGFGCAVFAPAGVIATRLSPAIWWWSIVVFVVVGAAVVVVNVRGLRPLVRGYWSERIVGEYLDGLERSGFRVLHDLPGDNFNVDHLLVATSGVYVVETKGIRRPTKGNPAPITYRDGVLMMGGQRLHGDPVAQVRAASATVERLLRAIGEDVPVRSVVIFPGRFVEGRPSKASDPWVLSLRAFPKWLAREPKIMDEDRVREVYRKLRLRVE